MNEIRRSQGLTLIELVIAIAVIAILVTIGFPAIQESIKNNRATAHSNELVALINFARNEAIRRNTTVPVELTQRTGGWSGLVRDPLGDGSEPCTSLGALRCADNERVLLSQTVTLDFNNRGYLRSADEAWVGETLFLTHQECTGNRQRTRIEVRPTGQVTSCAVGCTDTTTTC